MVENIDNRLESIYRCYTCTAISDAGVAVGELGVRVFVPLPGNTVVDSLRWTVLHAHATIVEVSTGLQRHQKNCVRIFLKTDELMQMRVKNWRYHTQQRYIRNRLSNTPISTRFQLQVYCLQCYCLQCFDAVGWAAGRASGL